ncbi:hypothetical protein SETIT_7G011400v2 [Setaria italica]|uniref:Late embryogenesis abundant protein LEA-2 subgroup domain-containing protein n=1 Tax=Setaria italica TaxID=4555 RepID=A0A368RR20_SETIT|nr:hypothetical protein SETIT_7G011400v2 [Setaria italica]
MPADGEEYSFCALCGTCVVQILLLSMMILLLAYALLYPVKVTVSDASLSRFALNGTALSYDLSLAVSLLFAGRRFYGARLVGTGHSVKLEKSGELRLRAVGQAENAAEVLGSDGVAELVKETVAGEIQSLELKLSGQRLEKPILLGRSKLGTSCWRRRKTPSGPNISLELADIFMYH